VTGCARRDATAGGTWITPEMAAAYTRLHELGHAHSVEIWSEGQLVGGLYGVALGRTFFAESMFSREANASKAAMVALAREMLERDFLMMDCQLPSPHLASMGAREVPRREFLALLAASFQAAERNSRSWPAGMSPILPRGESAA
jgi:leucyl/phenylalanyl-tRNA--protein transferase